jgi:1-acyl-sn-glycerol-3-phosphate acyltransferase
LDQTVNHTITAPITPAQHVKAGLKFTVLMIWLFVMLIPFLILEALKVRASAHIVRLWHLGARKITGIKVEITGTPCENLPLLLLGNHTSYLDIPVINALFTVNFIAKSEVRSWPGIGVLARCCQTIFVERRAIKSHEQIKVLREKILPDRRLVLFAEGTSTDGSVVLPFKSSLMEFVFDEKIAEVCHVQPMTVLCLKDAPVGAQSEPERVLYPWFDDTTLAFHFWRFMATSGCTVKVHFSPSRPVSEFENRKELTQWAHAGVQNGYDIILKKA